MQRLHGTSEEREDSQGDWRGARSHKSKRDLIQSGESLAHAYTTTKEEALILSSI